MNEIELKVAHTTKPLMFRLPPFPEESPWPYLWRLSLLSGHKTAEGVVQLMTNRLGRTEIGRITDDEWFALVPGHSSAVSRWLSGWDIRDMYADALLVKRHCVDCLQNGQMFTLKWCRADLGHCEQHQIALRGRCRMCDDVLTWDRGTPEGCHCGEPLVPGPTRPFKFRRGRSPSPAEIDFLRQEQRILRDEALLLEATARLREDSRWDDPQQASLAWLQGKKGWNGF